MAQTTAPPRPLLEIVDLTIEYPTREGVFTAVKHVTLSVDPGERLGLIGESGSGKSTIALSIMRLIKAPGRVASGQILLDGTDLLRLSEDDMRQRRLADVALITQGAMNSLNPVTRIGRQLADGIEAHGEDLSRAEMQKRIAALLESVNLESSVADYFPHQLSGGMKQRVCIATAISLNPRLIIADEPTSALDVVVQKRVIQTLRQVQKRIGAAVILIGHDMGLMAQFAQRMAVMRAGEILEMAPVRDIFRNPQHPYTRLLMESLPTLEHRGELTVPADITESPELMAEVSG